MMNLAISVGVSSCLLGNPVRYDGGHKRDRYVTDTLGRYFRFVPVCPEMECGLPVPREAMRLIGDVDNPQLVTNRTGVDHTALMKAFCTRKVGELENEDLCGFIFKRASPSSGLYRVKLYHPAGHAQKNGRGLFAAAVVKHFPYLPVEEEGRLHDAILRENFIEKVFSYRRWKEFLQDKPDYKKLIRFHTRQKLLIMAHSPQHYAALGKLVAEGKKKPGDQLLAMYEERFMEALSIFSTVKKNKNVLHHIMGYFKADLTRDEKAELLEVIGGYGKSLVPLTVPLTLVNHYVRKYDVSYLKSQFYLAPHPAELMLRNHV